MPRRSPPDLSLVRLIAAREPCFVWSPAARSGRGVCFVLWAFGSARRRRVRIWAGSGEEAVFTAWRREEGLCERFDRPGRVGIRFGRDVCWSDFVVALL